MTTDHPADCDCNAPYPCGRAATTCTRPLGCPSEWPESHCRYGCRFAADELTRLGELLVQPHPISSITRKRSQKEREEGPGMAGKTSQNYINHVALVLDESSSMAYQREAVVKATDALVASLADMSKKMDQETRVTVYTFSYADNIKCVFYDKDVLRLPSLKDRYRPNGMTALIDATMKSIDDLEHTWEGYGDHSFLIYVLTDGHENVSRGTATQLRARLSALPDHWTVAALVPDAGALHTAKSMGFPAGNVAVWNTTSATGVEEVASVITTATQSYMTSRSTGLRGSKSLFTIDPNTLKSQAVKAAHLKPLDASDYVLIPVTGDMPIKEFVEQCAPNYNVGKAYYQLNSGRKPKGRAGVKVQGNKQVIVVEKTTNKAFAGSEARTLIGLPDHEVTVDPTRMNADYDVYVQSTSLNRKLFAGTKLLMLR